MLIYILIILLIITQLIVGLGLVIGEHNQRKKEFDYVVIPWEDDMKEIYAGTEDFVEFFELLVNELELNIDYEIVDVDGELIIEVRRCEK